MFAAISLLSSVTRIRMGQKDTRAAMERLERYSASKFPDPAACGRVLEVSRRLHVALGCFADCVCAGRREVNREAIKRPKEVSLGEHTSLGPKATAAITVICLSPDLTLGVSSRTYSGMDTRDGAIKFLLSLERPFVKTTWPGTKRPKSHIG